MLYPLSYMRETWAYRDSNPTLRIKSPEHNHPCSKPMGQIVPAIWLFNSLFTTLPGSALRTDGGT